MLPVGWPWSGETSATSSTGARRHAWNTGKDWKPTSKTPRKTNGKKRRAVIRSLAKRDGLECIYCGCSLTTEDATVEHVVPLSLGGKDRLENMALACVECNNGFGNTLPALKIKLALEMRLERMKKTG